MEPDNIIPFPNPTLLRAGIDTRRVTPAMAERQLDSDTAETFKGRPYRPIPADQTGTRPTDQTLFRNPVKCHRCRTRLACRWIAGPNGPSTVPICNACFTSRFSPTDNRPS